MTSTSSFTAPADFCERGVLFGRQRDLDDLLDAARAELDRHADEQIADRRTRPEEHRARQDLLLVLEDGLDHLRRRRPGAYQALVPTSLVISAPPSAVRLLIAAMRSAESSSVIGMPATVE